MSFSIGSIQSGHKPGPVRSVRGPTDLVSPVPPDPAPDPAPAERRGAVPGSLAGTPTAADLAVWSRVFRALEEADADVVEGGAQ